MNIDEIKHFKPREESLANHIIRNGLFDQTVGQITVSRDYSRSIFRPDKLARTI